MCVLSDGEILEFLKKGDLRIAPFSSQCLGPSGYDLHSFSKLSIEPGRYSLVASMERVELGRGVIAHLYLRSSFAREGLIGSFAVVDPGFRGQLTMAIHNSGANPITIQKHEKVVQIVFHKLGRMATEGYKGVYQESIGAVKSKRQSLQK